MRSFLNLSICISLSTLKESANFCMALPINPNLSTTLASRSFNGVRESTIAAIWPLRALFWSVSRLVPNKKLIASIDLTNSSYLNSDFYQIQSGDIIIVNPNYTRVKNAGIIGNSGTLISLLSFILTSIILINN